MIRVPASSDKPILVEFPFVAKWVRISNESNNATLYICTDPTDCLNVFLGNGRFSAATIVNPKSYVALDGVELKQLIMWSGPYKGRVEVVVYAEVICSSGKVLSLDQSHVRDYSMPGK